MIYAAVLASGSGLRMGKSMPKQYLVIEGRPIVIRSIDAFLESSLADRIIVAVSADFEDYMKELIDRFIDDDKKSIISVTVGGKNRNETLINVLRDINSDIPFTEEDIILTHDAVRPFINNKIIEDNIEAARAFGACNTVIPAVDTMLLSHDGKYIDSVPVRSELFHAQTPQSFNAKLLFEIYSHMTDQERESFTDACSVLIARGMKVALTQGDRNNIKLTYPEDIEKAERIIKMRESAKWSD